MLLLYLLFGRLSNGGEMINHISIYYSKHKDSIILDNYELYRRQTIV